MAKNKPIKKIKTLLPKGHPDRAARVVREHWVLLKTDVSVLRPWPGNPRDNDESVEAVAESINASGFLSPIVAWKDEKGQFMVLAGHVRLKAAKKLGLKQVPVIMADGLTRKQAEEFALSDNKTAETSTWNLEMLQHILKDKEEAPPAGFSGQEIADILGGAMTSKSRKDKAQPSVLASLEKKVNCPKCGHKFKV